jgi:hypothetical protein
VLLNRLFTTVNIAVLPEMEGVTDTIRCFEAKRRETGEKFNLFKAAGIVYKERIMCRQILRPTCSPGSGR